MTNKGSVYTRKVIAQLLNLSEKRIKQLTDEGVIEEYSPGYYKLLPAIQGYVKYLQAQLSDDDKASDYNVEKAKLTKAKREDAELELKIKKNELHKAPDIEFIMSKMLIAFRSKLDILPYEVLPSILDIPEGLDKKDMIVKVLKKAVAEALNELSDYNPDFFNEEKYLSSLDDTVAE